RTIPAPTPPARTPADRPGATAWLAALALLAGAGLASAQGTSLGPPQAPARGQVIATPAPIPMPPLPSAQAPAPIVPVRYQPPRRPTGTDDEGQLEYQIQLEPPGIERLSLAMTSDADLQERIRQETIKRTKGLERVTFPEEPILSRDRYYGRGAIWP